MYELRACSEDMFICCIPWGLGFGTEKVNCDDGDWSDEGDVGPPCLRAIFSDWRRESKSRRLSFSFCFSWLTASRAETLSSSYRGCSVINRVVLHGEPKTKEDGETQHVVRYREKYKEA